LDLFSIRLKELRQNKAVTQKEVSNNIGMTDRGYYDFERGKHKPAFYMLVALADYFDVSLDYLVGRSEIKERR